MERATFKKKADFTRKFKVETSELPYLGHSCVWCWILGTSESRSTIPGKCWNVVLKNDKQDQLDRSCEKRKGITKNEGGVE